MAQVEAQCGPFRVCVADEQRGGAGPRPRARLGRGRGRASRPTSSSRRPAAARDPAPVVLGGPGAGGARRRSRRPAARDAGGRGAATQTLTVLAASSLTRPSPTSRASSRPITTAWRSSSASEGRPTSWHRSQQGLPPTSSRRPTPSRWGGSSTRASRGPRRVRDEHAEIVVPPATPQASRSFAGPRPARPGSSCARRRSRAARPRSRSPRTRGDARTGQRGAVGHRRARQGRRGEADAGLVYVTDARLAGDDVVVVDVPESEAVLNTYPIATVVDSDHEEAGSPRSCRS